MDQIAYNQDGTVNAAYPTPDGVTHHLHFPVSGAVYIRRFDGSADTSMLTTGTVTCTDRGCGMSMSVTFPLTGDAIAQQAHAMYRLGTGQQPSLATAAGSVIADVEAAGGTPRIDPGTAQPL